MEVLWQFRMIVFIAYAFFLFNNCYGQDEDGETPAAPPPALATCNGVFLSYTFTSREKEYPHVKNATAQAWAFKSVASIVNTGTQEVKGWEMFIGFQHKEILVSATGATVADSDFPVDASNGTTFTGTTNDLKTSIDTAGDFTQIAAQIEITGTQFGVKPSKVPMPKNIKLATAGYKCPQAKLKGKNNMQVCCTKDPKYKVKKAKKVKLQEKQDGDLSITYDILQSFGNNYQAQVTLDNNHPLGRLDHWNLTWSWKYNEFIYSMRGAYVRVQDASQCIYGAAGKYYADFDFSTVLTCDTSPIISDLPATFKNDTKLGKLEYCCRNGSLLPTLMDGSKSKSVFQMQVYKLPPNLNRTALEPPTKWKIVGDLNPQYKCAAPIRIEPTEYPNIYGLPAITTAIASWQIVCNISRPKAQNAGCCVSFSAYYNDSAIPCNTCACGCEEDTGCSETAKSMLLPAEALLVPFANRSVKAVAWAKINKFKIPKPRPCPDNCPVSINWHLNSDYKTGWTARITLFNWDQIVFEDWFAAIQIGKAYKGYENVYSFNGTKLDKLNKTIFLQGLKGLNYLMGETNGTRGSPRVPGKQQSVISFTKKQTPGINIAKGDGFPKRVYFNGEECALPTRIPIKSGGSKSSPCVVFTIIITLMLMMMMDNWLY